MAKEKKGRKFGRHRDRNPSSRAYTAGKRWIKNKALRAKRHARRMAKKAIHRIEWEISLKKTTLQASAERLQELRRIVSQNLTG